MAENILEHVWSNQIAICDRRDQSPVARMLCSLLTVPTVCFTSKLDQECETACVFIAGEEIMPGASLADVLFEELEIEVSDDTVIYIESTAMNQARDYSAKTLGQTIGDILVKLASPDQMSGDVEIVPAGLALSPRAHEEQLSWKKDGLVQLVQ